MELKCNLVEFAHNILYLLRLNESTYNGKLSNGPCRSVEFKMYQLLFAGQLFRLFQLETFGFSCY